MNSDLLLCEYLILVYDICIMELALKQSAKNIKQEKQARQESNHIGTPSQEYIRRICSLYGDVYDDREEDSKPNGLDWEPGVKACHKSISSFQKELDEIHGIHLSRIKLQKILITGGCWTTERSREIQWLFEEYTAPEGKNGRGLSTDAAIRAIAEHLEISTVSC